MSVHHAPPRYHGDIYGYDAPGGYVSRREYQQHHRNPDLFPGLAYGTEYDYEPHPRGAGRGAGYYNVESGFNNGEYYPSPHPSPPHYPSHRMMDMRDPTLQRSPRVRTSNQYLPADVIQGLESLSLHQGPKNSKGKKSQAKPVASLAREFEGVRSLGLTPSNKAYHDPRREVRKAPDGSETFRLTWSQTRRIQNLNRPMIPVSIKIPLHDKHLWWESPTVTLNMFAPYSNALVNGEKTIETRNYQLPNKCKGVRIGIVEIMPKNLPSKKPELIGEVVFVDCKEYNTKEEWEKDAPYHKVDANDERFGWKKNKKKFGWVVHTWQAYDRSIREAASEYCNTRVHYTKNFFVWAYV